MKPGWKTSEFYKSLIVALVPLAAIVGKLFGVDLDAAQLGTTMIGVIPAIAYVVGRTWLKAAVKP